MKGISNNEPNTIFNEAGDPLKDEPSLQFTDGLKATDDTDHDKIVVGVDTTFTSASSRTNLKSGDPLKTILGKIYKWFDGLKSVAFTGSYNDLADKPSIPTVNNKTLTINQNNGLVAKFTSNSATDVTANITVPTSLSQLSGDGTHRTVTDSEKYTWNNKSNFSGNYNDLSNKPTIGNGTLTIQKNGTNVATFTANQTGNATANLIIPTDNNQIGNSAGYITSSGSCAYATSAGTAVDHTARDTANAALPKSGGEMTGSILMDHYNNRINFIPDTNSRSYISYISNKYSDLHRPTLDIKGYNEIQFGNVSTSSGYNTLLIFDPGNDIISGGDYRWSLSTTSQNMCLNGGDYLNLGCSTQFGTTGRVQCRDTSDHNWKPIAADRFDTESSRRYKENIVDITDERASKILDINVVTFDYKEDSGHGDSDSRKDRTGVIAEDVANIIPEAVNFCIPYGHEDEFDTPVPDTVDYSKFTPYLIKMVQIQQNTINEMKITIDNQQKQINELLKSK